MITHQEQIEITDIAVKQVAKKQLQKLVSTKETVDYKERQYEVGFIRKDEDPNNNWEPTGKIIKV